MPENNLRALIREQAQFMDVSQQVVREDSGYSFEVVCDHATAKDVRLWLKLIKEEVAELEIAINDEPLANITAEACDVIYVVCGLLNTLGIQPQAQAMWDAIHKANMLKVGKDGKVVRREDGKILKPEGWRPVNKHQVFESASIL